MTGVEPYDRDVAMAFESYALYPQKTVEQNLASPLRSGPLRHLDACPAGRADPPGDDDAGHRPPAGAVSPASCPTGSASAPRSAECWSGPPTCTCWTSRSRTWTRSCAPRCVPSSKQLGEMSSTTTLYVTPRLPGGARTGRPGRGAAGGPAGPGRHARAGVARAGGHVRRADVRPAGDEPARRRPRRGADGGHRGEDRAAGSRSGCPPSWPARGGPARRSGSASGPGPGVVDGPEPADRLVLRGRVTLAERLGRLVELSVDVAGESGHRGDDPTSGCGRAIEVGLAVDW